MFERFTKDARDTVEKSVLQAERAGADSVTEEHLLLAILDQRDTRTARACAALGVTDRHASIRDALADARRRAGLSRADAEALAGLGIDVAEIVARVEETHGAGALGPQRAPRRWWSSRRPFGPAARETLVASLRIAAGRGDREIGSEHLLLALTARPGVVSEVLAEHGATHAAVRRAVYGEERAA
ncbi:Clp protease N-terminal domain-containing protein [Streptomyces sp. CAU 1734]|uniref:Clp protease N-terminal domain-containing protein n=1 Tax=Streptomyces sp. CAU 1734 TaxID=3140360 RepID=UPI0032613181